MSRIAVVVSMLFALVVALLAIVGSSALPTVAVVGGVLVGIMWVITGVNEAGRRRGGATDA